MLQNFVEIRQRLSTYTAPPQDRFRTRSGAPEQEETIKAKVRQYWADTTISNAQKLSGFKMDLSGFDPENTTNRQLREIGNVLADMGIVDYETSNWLSSINAEFDSQGNETNLDKKVNIYDYFKRELDVLTARASEGKEYAKDTLTKLKTVMSVTDALVDHAKGSRQKSLVSLRV